MLNSFISFFTPSEKVVVLEPQVGVANVVYGNGWPEGSMRSFIDKKNRKDGTATYHFNECEPVVVECDKAIEQSIVNANAESGCPTEFDAICRYEKGAYSEVSRLKVESNEQSKSWFSWGSSEEVNKDIEEKVPVVKSTKEDLEKIATLKKLKAIEDLEKIATLKKLKAIRLENEALKAEAEALKAEANKSFIQKGLEWLGIANFFDYNQDGNVSLDDIKDAANEHP